jgi:hypothetical protein
MIPVGGSDAHFEGELGECVLSISAAGDSVMSLRNVLLGRGEYSVYGIPQMQSDLGRKYAPTYYRFKKYVKLPRPLVPIASVFYRAYRNNVLKRGNPALEEKFKNEDKESH